MTTKESKMHYLDDASRTVGNMLHNAVYEYGMDGNDICARFVQSGIAKEIEEGNPKYLAGISGYELLLDIMEKTSERKIERKEIETCAYSDAYWVGWILVHYQFYSGRSFQDILTVIPYDELLSLYDTLHEADPTKSCEVFEAHFGGTESKLKTIRLSRFVSQEQLSKESNVSLPTIRAYEQGSKDIRKAQINILIRLAETLRCDVKELI